MCNFTRVDDELLIEAIASLRAVRDATSNWCLENRAQVETTIEILSLELNLRESC